ncbi:hypothetical protein GQ53DRAFT_772843 [Thozetella sp. PMI_491]|nr:hypothetical protein GQ53DRAFT_772843 [Thozetella sp. PMI_491]
MATSNPSDVVSRLPPEIILRIFDSVQPVGSMSTYGATSEVSEISPDYLEARTTLSNAARASRMLCTLATEYLYRTVVLRSDMELLLFFRTLVISPRFRFRVKALAWAGDMAAQLEPVHTAIRELWVSLGWPACDGDRSIAKSVGIAGADIPRTPRVLAALLAMVPKVKHLVVLFSAVRRDPLRSDGAQMALEKQAFRFLIKPPKHVAIPATAERVDVQGASPDRDTEQPDHGTHASSEAGRFLQDLEVVTFQKNEHHRLESASIFDVLHRVLLNCPRIRRIEVKSQATFGIQIPMDRGDYRQLLPAASETVKEVLLFRGHVAQDILPAVFGAFPNLASFAAEYAHGGPVRPWSDPYCLYVSDALMTISGTLQRLTLTTILGNSWNTRDLPPLLPALRGMEALKWLTTESIWLFGGQDPLLALNIVDFLPPSLVDLGLIDYWGVYDTENWYPTLPHEWQPLHFLGQMLVALCEQSMESLPALRSVMISSPLLSPDAARFGSDGQQDEQDIIAFVSNFQRLFAGVGISFSHTSAVFTAPRFQARWAYVNEPA